MLKRITNVADSVEPTDAVNERQVDAALDALGNLIRAEVTTLIGSDNNIVQGFNALLDVLVAKNIIDDEDNFNYLTEGSVIEHTE